MDSPQQKALACPRETDEGAAHASIPLLVSRHDEHPIVCIPGAGASVTCFLDLVAELGPRWPVYGLQPRGLNPKEKPHDSVEAAAGYNLQAIRDLTGRPVHLIGHSHGGRVACEMASQMLSHGQAVASLMLIDSEPPDPFPTQNGKPESDIRREYVRALALTFGQPIHISAALVSPGPVQPFIEALHAALVKSKSMPERSSPGSMERSFATFAAARRTAYTPRTAFPGRAHLVLACEPGLRATDDQKRRDGFAQGWRRHVAELTVWLGPGNHFSILQGPQARSLARHWQDTNQG